MIKLQVVYYYSSLNELFWKIHFIFIFYFFVVCYVDRHLSTCMGMWKLMNTHFRSWMWCVFKTKKQSNLMCLQKTTLSILLLETYSIITTVLCVYCLRASSDFQNPVSSQGFISRCHHRSDRQASTRLHRSQRPAWWLSRKHWLNGWFFNPHHPTITIPNPILFVVFNLYTFHFFSVYRIIHDNFH